MGSRTVGALLLVVIGMCGASCSSSPPSTAAQNTSTETTVPRPAATTTPATTSTTSTTAGGSRGGVDLCNIPQSSGTVLSLVLDGFVRQITAVGGTPWVALVGGNIIGLDSCGNVTATISIAATAFPQQAAGERVDFTSFDGDSDSIIWSVVTLRDDATGEPKAEALARIDTAAGTATALPLSNLEFSRTAKDLAVRGSNVWLANAVGKGTASRIDPDSGQIVATIPLSTNDSFSEDLTADSDGNPWGITSTGIYEANTNGLTAAEVPGVSGAGGISDLTGAGGLMWAATSGGLVAVDDNTHAVVATVAGQRATLIAPASSGVWIADGGSPTFLTEYSDSGAAGRSLSIPNPPVSFSVTADAVWVVDFNGVAARVKL